MNIIQKWKSASPYLLSVLRMVAAFMFILAGTMKLFAYPMGMPPNGGTVHLSSQIGVAGVIEIVGGFLLLLGFCTRPIAFILSGEMAIAYFQFHNPISVWPVINNGVGAVLYCFIWLYISAAGPGPLSIDAARKR